MCEEMYTEHEIQMGDAAMIWYWNRKIVQQAEDYKLLKRNEKQYIQYSTHEQ